MENIEALSPPAVALGGEGGLLARPGRRDRLALGGERGGVLGIRKMPLLDAKGIGAVRERRASLLEFLAVDREKSDLIEEPQEPRRIFEAAEFAPSVPYLDRAAEQLVTARTLHP